MTKVISVCGSMYMVETSRNFATEFINSSCTTKRGNSRTGEVRLFVCRLYAHFLQTCLSNATHCIALVGLGLQSHLLVDKWPDNFFIIR